MSMSTPARALALFISDLHLQESHPRTADAFFRFLKNTRRMPTSFISLATSSNTGPATTTSARPSTRA